MKLFNEHFGEADFSNENQRSILQLAKTTDTIALIPVPKNADGNIEHFYHFVFDLLFPLSLLINKTPSKLIFLLRDFGVLTPVLLKLFGGRVKIHADFDTISEKKIVNLVGMNPMYTTIGPRDYRRFKKVIYKKLEFKSVKKPNKIILIERLPPSDFYLNDATKKGSGSSRRSIKNHEELERTIKSRVAPGFEFHNLKLENISFEEQIAYFDSAAVVIAQHGAGLVNMLWLPKNSIVVEFGFKSKVHFSKMAAVLKQQHFLFDNNDRHIEVNCAELSTWLIENKATRPFFN